MILRNNLYKTISANRKDRRFGIELIPDSIIYKAHFPERPITPGVCIIQIVGELLADLLGANVQLLSVGNAKFINVIEPNCTKQVDVTFVNIITDEKAHTIKVSVIVDNKESGTIFTKLSLLYKLK
jgi:3-hydroxyacyl-[acyl-carrier-protein] dehydratase